jgi:hypothetical protein
MAGIAGIGSATTGIAVTDIAGIGSATTGTTVTGIASTGIAVTDIDHAGTILIPAVHADRPPRQPHS